jgi:TetR/AcrR family transcriptional repressor of nem operon
MKKTEKILIDVTFGLIYKKGYAATSLTELLDMAGMTKGAMYYHFKSKHVLVLATLKHYLEFILQEHWITPLKDSDKPIETLIQQVNAYHDMFADKKHFLEVKHGCPLSNFILDMSNKDDEIFTYLKSVYTRWQLAVEDALIRGNTSTAFDAKKQALFIISSVEGSIGSAKAYNDIQTLKDSLEILTNHIKTL